MQLFITFVLFFLAVANATNYCDRSLCDNKQHIACNHRGDFSPVCQSPKILPIKDYRSLILRLHNKLRNEIASGNVETYPNAARMATMSWDNELAKLAKLNVKQCVMNHDACHNTKRYRNSGQNLACSRNSHPTPEEFIKSGINSWFNEYKELDSSAVDSYYTGGFTGHFALMVMEKNNKIGCALIQHIVKETTQYNLACNYATGLLVNQPLYTTTGTPGSQCKAGLNKSQKSLCKIIEEYKY